MASDLPTGSSRGGTDAPPRDESAAAIIQRLAANFAALARAYADLAQDEARATVRGIVRGLVCIGVAAVIGVYAVGLMLLTVVRLLALAVPPWLAALITFAGTVVVIAVLVAIGIRGFTLRRLHAVAAQVRSDIQWLRHEILKNI
ncbi:MAG TPA: phage holin family protein [bacterium]|nr:phage holin family protein [bacterium]